MSAAPCTVRRLDVLDDATIDALADVVADCVAGGASIGFMQPLARERVVAFWHRTAAGVAARERILLVAEDEDGICGTVQVVFAPMANQPHRADLAKMLVHRRARRRGVGAMLLRAAEDVARVSGRTLLVLDTASDDAERLYARHRWQRVGAIPGYALWPDGGLCTATLYYRDLTAP